MDTVRFVDNLIVRYIYPKLFQHNTHLHISNQDIVDIFNQFLENVTYDDINRDQEIDIFSDQVCNQLLQCFIKTTWDARFPIPAIKNEIYQYVILRLSQIKETVNQTDELTHTSISTRLDQYSPLQLAQEDIQYSQLINDSCSQSPEVSQL